MEKIEWITPVRSKRPVGINQVKVKRTISSGGEYTEIAFYGESAKNITNGDYIKAGVGANRIYFDKADMNSGFKMTRGYKEIRYIRLRGFRERFVGVHDLEYDADSCLWYIEA